MLYIKIQSSQPKQSKELPHQHLTFTSTSHLNKSFDIKNKRKTKKIVEPTPSGPTVLLGNGLQVPNQAGERSTTQQSHKGQLLKSRIPHESSQVPTEVDSLSSIAISIVP